MDSNYELIKTKDGSYSLFNREYGEMYHSHGGAVTEAWDRYIYPCKIQELARNQETVSILEVGFGLGVNLAATLQAIEQANPRARLRFVSLENDDQLFSLLPEIPASDGLEKEFQVVCELGKSPDHTYTSEGLDLSVVVGDGTQTVTQLEGPFDAIYLDAFSPRKNPELWTLKFLSALDSLLLPQGILSTFSISINIRLALMACGFSIAQGPAAAAKSKGTLASREGELPPWDQKTRARLERRFRESYPQLPLPLLPSSTGEE